MSFNFMAAVTICCDFGAKNIKSATVSTVSPSISHEVMGPDAMIFVFCQEATQVVWYSHLFPNFPQFIVIHTVKGFSIVNKAEIDIFLELKLKDAYCLEGKL